MLIEIIRVYGSLFSCWTLHEAVQKLRDLGLNPDALCILRSGDRDWFTKQMPIFSYNFFQEGKNIATYSVGINKMLLQPGHDGNGREWKVEKTEFRDLTKEPV